VILKTSQYTKSTYRKYIPQYFFVEIQNKNSEDNMEMNKDLINDFDASDFSNVFIIWNT
jgi:hypothetical protein